ncbi:MAG: hypothetical protein CO184_00185 [Candidatus Zambryskibacteria bacterium CG_4_9_14_3_um_filter_40_16]|uniref:SCP domain-containing protein n=1 Tax=Candidatus Zambryskibacteria bacterium CG_4_9_14_3_um_filter_40_16 TaxID=1975111 RepID=A0A2M7WVD0_9BACT|nr:MAG: hypothetical protein CO184_00185 [Candidatus Zambryskibacteria bacterium CG_4_9_14_3_um_filter_40_16]
MGKIKFKKLAVIFIVLATIVASLSLFWYLNTRGSFNKISDFIKNGNSLDILQNIQKEVSTPGSLVSKIESSRSYLTNPGVFAFTNKERANIGLSALLNDSGLNKVAEERLSDMFARQYFEHVSPIGESASTVADDFMYEYISIGENIALGNFEDDRTLVGAWMNSPGHRANILNPKFTNLGVAVGRGGYEGKSTWIGVQIFSKPLSQCPTVSNVLKGQIDSIVSEIDILKVQIDIVQEELQTMEKSQRNRENYNQKVEEYNALAKEINSKNAIAKGFINNYNEQVKLFNICIAN